MPTTLGLMANNGGTNPNRAVASSTAATASLTEKQLVEMAIRQIEGRRDILPNLRTGPAKNTKPLDSPYLSWRSGTDKRFNGVTWSELLAMILLEIKTFRKIAQDRRACMDLFDSLRSALLRVVKDPSQAAAVAIAENPVELCDAWVAFLVARKKEIIQRIATRRSTSKASFRTSGSRGLTESCMLALGNSTRNSHPRGGKRKVISLEASDDDPSTDDSDPGTHAPPNARKARELPPLTLDANALTQLKLIRETPDPKDLQPRTIDWLADTFCDGSELVANLLSSKSSLA